MTLTSPSTRQTDRPNVAGTLVFQLEVFANAEGDREICHVECDPTNEEPTDELEALDLGAGSWEFIFTLPANFDGSEPLFRKFQKYRLDPGEVVAACADAAAGRAS